MRIDVRKRLGAFDFAADLDLPLQGLTALFGASGAGKSTLVNLVSGLHRPDRGHIAVGPTVFFDSATGVDVPVERRALGVVFQDARLFPHMTVHRNLLFGLKRAGARVEERADRSSMNFDGVVDLLGLRSRLDQRPRTLSGGEKQRVALGRALLAHPHLLLMDEPLASLDAPRKAEIIPTIERLRDETAIPILYVSHALDEVLRLATSLVVVDNGAVIAAGEVSEVLRQPAVQRSLGDADIGTLVFGRVKTHDDAYELTTIDCSGFELHVPRVDLPTGSALRARVPARGVALSLARPSDLSISNRIEGGIESIVPLPGPYVEVLVRVSTDAVIAARITRESADRLALVPGLRVWCLIKSVALDAGALALARGRAARRVAVSANDERLDGNGSPR
ncbi:MAG: molybdenum ABC transporter ATP-binding protein [Burkholderiales bacterium]